MPHVSPFLLCLCRLRIHDEHLPPPFPCLPEDSFHHLQIEKYTFFQDSKKQSSAQGHSLSQLQNQTNSSQSSRVCHTWKIPHVNRANQQQGCLTWEEKLKSGQAILFPWISQVRGHQPFDFCLPEATTAGSRVPLSRCPLSQRTWP